jgi:hypothetical protein
MKTFLAQNQFMSSEAIVPEASGSAGITPCPRAPAVPNSAEALPSSQTAGSAVALKAACPGATAGIIQVSDGVFQESLPSGEIDPSVMLDCPPSESISDIPEIFHWVRKLLKDDRRFVLDEGAFMAEIEEEPLFLRSAV